MCFYQYIIEPLCRCNLQRLFQRAVAIFLQRHYAVVNIFTTGRCWFRPCQLTNITSDTFILTGHWPLSIFYMTHQLCKLHNVTKNCIHRPLSAKTSGAFVQTLATLTLISAAFDHTAWSILPCSEQIVQINNYDKLWSNAIFLISATPKTTHFDRRPSTVTYSL